MSKIYKYKLNGKVTTLNFENVTATFLKAAEQNSTFGQGAVCWVRLDDSPEQFSKMTLHMVMTGEDFDSKLKWLCSFETKDGIVVHVMEEK